MAYREFIDDIPVVKIDPTPIGAGITELFQGINEYYNRKQRASDQYKYALDYGHFENDNKFNEQYAGAVVNMGRSDYKKLGSPSGELLKMEEQGRRYVADQKAQYEQFKNLNTEIDKLHTADPRYYDPKIDRENLKSAAFGTDDDIDFRTRGQRLQQVSGVLGKDPRSFLIDPYTSDYVKGLGQIEQETKKGNTVFSETYSYKTPFVDPNTGKPGVTDQHAVDYLKSRPEVNNRLRWEVDNDILQTVKGLQSSKDKRVSWTQGLTDAQILDEVRMDPSKNPYSKEGKEGKPVQYNDLIIEKAKSKLQKAADLSEKVLVDYKKAPSYSDGNVNNDNIGHTFSFFNTPTTTAGTTEEVANAFGIGSVGGPGGVLMIKKGANPARPITFESEATSAYNYRDGKTTDRQPRGKFNLTGYQLMPYNNDGTVFKIGGKDFNELKKNIENINPAQLRGMKPSLQIGLQGYSIDEGKFLGDLAEKDFQLNEKLGDAIESGDLQEQNKIQQQINNIQSLKGLANQDGVFDQDLINAAARTGIKSVRSDLLLPANRADLDKIKTFTEGLDLGNESNWSKEMRELNDLYKKKWAQANGETTTKKAAPSKISQPNLNQGEIMVIGPDKKRYALPADQKEEAIKQGYQILN